MTSRPARSESLQIASNHYRAGWVISQREAGSKTSCSTNSSAIRGGVYGALGLFAN